MPKQTLAGKKVKHIAQCAGISFEKLRVFTLGTGNNGKFFILDIKYFCQSFTGSSYLIQFVVLVTTFGAYIF